MLFNNSEHGKDNEHNRKLQDSIQKSVVMSSYLGDAGEFRRLFIRVWREFFKAPGSRISSYALQIFSYSFHVGIYHGLLAGTALQELQV